MYSRVLYSYKYFIPRFLALVVFLKSIFRKHRVKLVDIGGSETGSSIYLLSRLKGCHRCKERNHPREEEAFQKREDSSDPLQDEHWVRLNSSESLEQVSFLVWSRVWNFSIETQCEDHITGYIAVIFFLKRLKYIRGEKHNYKKWSLAFDKKIFNRRILFLFICN